jgi:hypothetical protein
MTFSQHSRKQALLESYFTLKHRQAKSSSKYTGNQVLQVQRVLFSIALH